MRSKRDRDKDIAEETEEVEELSEKEQKKLKLKVGVEKRKNTLRKDKVARWGGLILLGLIMFVGFLLWVSGEMKNDGRQQNNLPTYQQTNIPTQIQQGTVIVK